MELIVPIQLLLMLCKNKIEYQYQVSVEQSIVASYYKVKLGILIAKCLLCAIGHNKFRTNSSS